MEYKCDKCGKQATVHYQTCEVRWFVNNDEIDLSTQTFLYGEDSEYFCDVCHYTPKKKEIPKEKMFDKNRERKYTIYNIENIENFNVRS